MCCCDAPLNCVNDDRFFMISNVHNEVETLLIRNLVLVDSFYSHFVVCFRLEFIEDGCVIIPTHFLIAKTKLNPSPTMHTDNFFA